MSDNQGFVFYRLPNQHQIRFLQGKLVSFNSNQQHNGFVMAPFDASKQAWLLKSEQLSGTHDYHLFNLDPHEDASEEAFCAYVEQIKTSIQTGNILKAVAARALKIAIPNEHSPKKVFESLCKAYPAAFCYLFSSSQTGTWLGATPEQFLKIEEQQLHTVALAGTQKKGAESWSNKENEEQQLVLRDIIDRLQSIRLEPKVSEQHRIEAGNLVHLVNEIIAPISAEADRFELLQLLHPTPAVGGLPRKEALEVIASNENVNRRYYSGYLGPWNAKSCNLFVNLRCMEWGSDAIRLYAGAGIVAQSDPKSEWNETAEKMKTVGQFVVNV